MRNPGGECFTYLSRGEMFHGGLDVEPWNGWIHPVDLSSLASGLTEFDEWPTPAATPHTVAEKPLVGFMGRLDNRPEIIAALALDRRAPEAGDDSKLLAVAWRRWGETLPDRLTGDFALAILDFQQRRLMLVRDPLGCKPLYFSCHRGRLVFGTSVASLLPLLSAPASPDPDWIARYLLTVSWSFERTGYREIVKLAPGHALSMDYRGHLRIWCYFVFRDDPAPDRYRDDRWVDAYRDCLEEAIRCRMTEPEPLGTENSGGLDSASISAYLAHLLGEPDDRLHAFGFVQTERKPGHILDNSLHAGITHNHLFTKIPLLDDGALELALSILGYPAEHGSGSAHVPVYRECRLHGIRTLFSGFGGDEVVTNPAQHLRWELLDDGNWRGLLEIFPGHPWLKGPRLLKALATRHRCSEYDPERMEFLRGCWPHHIVHDAVMERLDLTEAYWDMGHFSAPYRRINDFILKDRLSAAVATRLESSTLMAAYHGVEYCWPLLDTRLIQQYLSTPSIEKGGPKGIGRYLHRRAVAHVLPASIAWRYRKDPGSHVPRLKPGRTLTRLVDEARRQEARLHPLLEELVDREKFRRQIQQVRDGQVDQYLDLLFFRTVLQLCWLNHWLHGGPPD